MTVIPDLLSPELIADPYAGYGELREQALFTRFPGLALATDEPRWLQVPGQRRLAELPVRLSA